MGHGQPVVGRADRSGAGQAQDRQRAARHHPPLLHRLFRPDPRGRRRTGRRHRQWRLPPSGARHGLPQFGLVRGCHGDPFRRRVFRRQGAAQPDAERPAGADLCHRGARGRPHQWPADRGARHLFRLGTAGADDRRRRDRAHRSGAWTHAGHATRRRHAGHCHHRRGQPVRRLSAAVARTHGYQEYDGQGWYGVVVQHD